MTLLQLLSSSSVMGRAAQPISLSSSASSMTSDSRSEESLALLLMLFVSSSTEFLELLSASPSSVEIRLILLIKLLKYSGHVLFGRTQKNLFYSLPWSWRTNSGCTIDDTGTMSQSHSIRLPSSKCDTKSRIRCSHDTGLVELRITADTWTSPGRQTNPRTRAGYSLVFFS